MVYDLTVSDDHSFVAGGVVVHNCTTVPVVTGFKPVQWETGKDWFRKQSPATQKKVLGPGAWNLWKDGQIELEQTATVHRNDIWGDSVRPTPLRDLVSGTADSEPHEPGAIY